MALGAVLPLHTWGREAPPFQPPPWPVKRIATVAELNKAFDRAKPNQVFVLAPGTYALSEVILVRDTSNLVIMGGDPDPSKTVLRGPGWVGEHGGGPHFNLIGASGISFANITMEETRTYGIKVSAEGHLNDIHVYNCRFKNIGVRAIKGSGGSKALAKGGSIRWCKFSCDRIPPRDWLFDGNYITAIDMMALDGWTISDNEFRDLKGASGEARAAIFLWVNCKRVTIERNLILNCDRGIGVGNPHITAEDKAAGMWHAEEFEIRNNAIVTSVDAGIEISWARDVRVSHNSICRLKDAENGRGIRGVTGSRLEKVVLANNLVHGKLWDAPGLEQRTNLFGNCAGCFANPESGDLRLTPQAAAAVNKGQPLEEVKEDFDGNARDPMPDLGAWEFGAKPAPSVAAPATGPSKPSELGKVAAAPQPAAPEPQALPEAWKEKIRARVIQALKDGARPKAYLTLFGNKPESVRLAGADAKGLKVEVQGNPMPWSWTQLKEPDWPALATAVLGENDGQGHLTLGVALYCAGKSDEAEGHFAQAILRDAKIKREDVERIVKELR
ncbi:MAG: right-handed parallel beta-helix repeat-containing protein [Planctomycetota bacterium]|nr:right-handed parallel beta-helix repeat-containing protein [Planctomycetota bacterium]